MVDLPSRIELESELARRLAREMEDARRVTVALLGDPPDLAKLTPETWQAIEKQLSGAILPALEAAFVDTVQAFADNLGYAFDMTLVNERAAAWALQNAQITARGINEVSLRLLRRYMADYFNTGVTIGDLRRQIGTRVYSAQRVETIAQTEITRASVEGERGAVRELQGRGIRFKAIWNTSNDSLTCPICAPRNQVDISTIGNAYPPAHARCRCWVNHEVVTDDSNQG